MSMVPVGSFTRIWRKIMRRFQLNKKHLAQRAFSLVCVFSLACVSSLGFSSVVNADSDFTLSMYVNCKDFMSFRIGTGGPQFNSLWPTSGRDYPLVGPLISVKLGSRDVYSFVAGETYQIVVVANPAVDSGSSWVYGKFLPSTVVLFASETDLDDVRISDFSFDDTTGSITFEFIPAYSFSCKEISVVYPLKKYNPTFNNCHYTYELNGSEYEIIGEGHVTITSALNSDPIVDAIENQTDDMNQNHQETMDKIDDVTDFDEQEQGSLSGDVSGAEDQLNEKLGLLTWASDLIQRVADLFFGEPVEAQLVFPAYTMEVQGVSYQVWEDTTFSFEETLAPFEALLTGVRFVLVFLVYAALINYLVKTLEKIIHGNVVSD